MLAIRTPSNADRKVQVLVAYSSQRVRQSETSKVTRYKGGRTLYHFKVRHSSDEWILTGIESIS